MGGWVVLLFLELVPTFFGTKGSQQERFFFGGGKGGSHVFGVGINLFW